MVPLKNMSVRIIVHHSDYKWAKKNLFGTIIKDRGNNLLIVRLNEAIESKTLKSDLLKLIPRTEKDSFRTLAQLSSTFVNGELLTEGSEESDFVLTGTVTFD
jgi:hypothetical protein